MLDENKEFQIEDLFNYIQNFDNINYINIKGINKFLTQKVRLKLLQDFEIKRNTLIFYNDNADNLINDIKEIIRNKKYDFSKLEKFLNKSEIRFVIKQMRGKNKVRVIYKSKKEYGFIQNEDALTFLNFDNLSKFILNQEDSEKKNDYKISLEKAYIMCYIGKYYDAYKIYKQISENALKNKEFYIYSISEFNRYYVGKIVRNCFIYGPTITEKVQKEIEKIELDKILLSYSFNSEEHEFIKSIISWNFINSNKILNIKQKIDKDENTCYAWIAKDSTGIYQFQNYIERFWKFIRYNLLAIDSYREIQEVFYNYIDSILRSYTIPKVYLSEENSFFGEKSENIKVEELSVFDLKCIVEYLGCKELENIFQRYEINEIKVKENEIDEFILIIKNIINFLKIENNKYNFSFDINLIFLLLSVIKFNDQQYRTITQYILEYLNYKKLNTNEYKYLNKYLYYQKEYFNNFNLDLLVDILLNILGKISSLENIDDIIISTIHNIVCYIHEDDKKFKLNNGSLINLLFNNSSNDMYSVLIELYRILDVSEKHKIRNAIKNRLKSNKYEVFECEIYYKSLMSKIIEPNSQYELKYCDFIQNKKKEKERLEFCNLKVL